MAIGLGRACWRPHQDPQARKGGKKGRSQLRLSGSLPQDRGHRGAAERNARDRGRAPHRPDAWGVEACARLVALARRVRRTTVPGRRAILDGLTAAFLGDAQPFSCSGRARGTLDAVAASSYLMRVPPCPACRRSAGARVWAALMTYLSARGAQARSDGAPRRPAAPPSPGRIHARNRSIPINGWYRAHPHTAQMLAAISSRPARQFRAVCCRRCSPSRRNERIASGTPEEGTLRPWS